MRYVYNNPDGHFGVIDRDFKFKFKIARKQLWKSSNVSPNLFPVYMLSSNSSFFLNTFNKSEFNT